jgi:molybdopterin synthase sulfur carrier subunit
MNDEPSTKLAIAVTVKLFAAYQEAFGLSQLKLEFPIETPVSEVLERLLADRPELEPWRNLTRFGINLEFVEPDTILKDKDEVVLIPPVSGG